MISGSYFFFVFLAAVHSCRLSRVISFSGSWIAPIGRDEFWMSHKTSSSDSWRNGKKVWEQLVFVSECFFCACRMWTWTCCVAFDQWRHDLIWWISLGVLLVGFSSSLFLYAKTPADVLVYCLWLESNSSWSLKVNFLSGRELTC